ncbi:MAG: gamma-glutamyltransferase [Holophagales bacterium]|nr:gamma-glutamyltransferase [Holophagales bacterium]MYD22969.1 gamma-glutamyltransferase [Holophagales bacterium]MYI32430.1 gamma-glutamyltransferase [Holophagales bacterium]
MSRLATTASRPLARRPVAGALLAAFLLGVSCAGPEVARDAASGRSSWGLGGTAPAAQGTQGMVVSGHGLASDVGAAVLEQGGNAIDAAVAVGFALSAVLPAAGNIGGGGFLVYRSNDGEVRALDYREKAPGAATRDMFVDDEGKVAESAVIGHLAAGVPGSVAGLWEMHRTYGSLPWSDLVTPAIELAHGHEIDEPRARSLKSAAPRLSRFPASAMQFLVDGEAPSPGAILEQRDLAATLQAIAEQGPDGFYRGRVADLIVAEMERGGGLISHQDLEDYAPVWREPVEVAYRGHTIHSMPPVSSGGLTLGLILNILEGWDSLPPFGSPDLIHLEAEAMRLAFRDRNTLLGDPDFVDVPRGQFESQDYADGLRARIDPERARPLPPIEVAPPAESTETTHYSVVDRWGNAASVTTTINSGFGNAVTVTGAGFLLNNEMDDFAASPGQPNQFGLVEGENNAIVPGKRMLSSMTPSIVLSPEGELMMVVGTPGGPTIITTVYHVISNVIDHGMGLRQAVESPRVHHQAWPDQVFYEEGGLGGATLEDLAARGHELVERGLSGDVSAILVEGSSLLGVADPRRGGGVSAPRGDAPAGG